MWKERLILAILVLDQVLTLGVQTYTLNLTEIRDEHIRLAAETNPDQPVVYSLKREKRSLADDYSLHFKRIAIHDPSDNILNESQNKTNFAAHGLHFVKQGRAFIFTDYWIQFMKLDAPFFKSVIDTSNFEDTLDKFFDECALYVENATDIKEKFNFNYAKTMVDESLVEIRNILLARAMSFKEVNSRKKRFIGVLAAGAIALASTAVGFFLGKNNADLEEKVDAMEYEIRGLSDRQKLITETMVGFMDITNERFDLVEQKMRALTKTTQNSFDKLTYQINDLAGVMEREFQRVFITSTVIEGSNRIIDNFQNLVTVKLEEYDFWDKVFISLRKGLLPRELFSYEKLKKLTDDIEAKLIGEFEIAFSSADNSLFYNLPLVQHTIEKITVDNEDNYDLYLKIKIPLKRKRAQSEYLIYTPNSFAFPCETESCFLKSKTKNKLISFDLGSTSWLIHPETGAVVEEAELSHFSCFDTFDEKICYTFQPNLLKTPTPCTYSIHLWNQTGILEHCNFKQRHPNDYRVIPISNHQYIVHQHVVPEFFETCGTSNANKIRVNEWAVVISLGQSCDALIPLTRQRVYGPFSAPLNDSNYMENYGYHSTLVNAISKKFQNMQIEYTGFESELNLTEISTKEEFEKLNLELNNDQLSSLAKKSIMIAQNFKTAINKLDNKVHTIKYRATFWGLFALASDFIHFAVTIVFIFGTLTYSRFFGVVIVANQPVQAWEINLLPKINILPPISMHVLEDVAFISWALKVVMVFVLIIGILIVMTTKCFRTVKITSHYGQYVPLNQPQNQRFSVIISIYNKTKYFTYLAVESINLKAPLVPMNTDGVAYIEVRNPLLPWSVQQTAEGSAICIPDEITLNAYNDKHRKIRTKNQTIVMPINRIQWTTTPPTSLFNNNFDCAQILVIRESDPPPYPVPSAPTLPTIHEETAETAL